MAVLRSYPVNLVPDRELPRGLFDPRWQEPRIAAKVALEHYKRSRARGEPTGGALSADATIPRHPRAKTEERSFTLDLTNVLPGFGTRFKGGAFNELHRRYSFGGGQPPVNFHAQVVCFGADEEGRWLVRATVGRWDGRWGNEAALTVRFFAGATALGGVAWARAMDPAEDVEVELSGRDAVLATRFGALDRAVVAFYAHHHGESAPTTREGSDEGERGALDEALDVFGSKE